MTSLTHPSNQCHKISSLPFKPPQDKYVEMYGQLVASIFGLLATSCDSLLTRRKEMEYVWKRPLRMTFVRCLFILSRYLALSIHIVRVVFASLLIVWFPDQQPTYDICVTWLIIHIVSCNTMLLVLELILSIRVFALYDKSLRIGMFLSTVLLGRVSGSIYVASKQVFSRGSHFKFFGYCQVTRTIADPIGDPMLVFIIGEIVIHAIIHGLAMKRTTWDFRRFTLPQPPLVSMLNRDGLRVFVAISVGMVAFGLSTDTKIGLPGQEAVKLFIYPLFISLVSTLGCHTILNLQMLDVADTSSSKENTGIELTTINNPSIWDTASTRFELDTTLRPVEEVI